MTVSVIIPVYNVERFIRRCLDSVVCQKCDGFDIECIIVDDCSPDGSMRIAREIIDAYHGNSITFRIVRHEKNKGISAARNSGIKAATGDFLFFVDSDDDIVEDAFSKLVSYSVLYPSSDVIMGTALYAENNSLSNAALIKDGENFCLISDKHTIMEHVLRCRVDRNVWNKLIRRSLVIEHNLLFEEGILFEDVLWTYNLYLVLSSILIVSDMTYIYEYNPSSSLHTPKERSDIMVRSLVHISKSLLDSPLEIGGKTVQFTAHALFIFHWMLRAIDYKQKHGAETSTCFALESQKKKLFKYSFKHFNPFMTLYFMTMFKPFCLLLKLRAFRRNIDKIDCLVYKFLR